MARCAVPARTGVSLPTLAVAAALGVVDLAAAASGDGTAGGILARLPFGARSLALGGMHGSLRDSPSAMHANPAALSSIDGITVEAGLHQSAGDTRYGGLAASGAPLPWLTAGVSYASLTAGELEAWDVVGTKYTADLQEDRVIGAAAAAAWGPAAFGVGLRHYASTVVGVATGSAVLADLGVRVRLALAPPPGWLPEVSRRSNPNGVDLSLAATGLGGAAAYGGAADPGPVTFRLGAGLNSSLGRGLSVLLASVDTPRETARLQAATGWELRMPIDEALVTGRVGARFRKGSSTLGAGAGVEFRGIAVDYAFVTADGPFAATHHLTAAFRLEAFRRAMSPPADRFEPLPPAGGATDAPGAPTQPEPVRPTAAPPAEVPVAPPPPAPDPGALVPPSPASLPGAPPEPPPP